mmetsp:Transcript_65557/g.156725  ORF Transcript_65557/g.156725 Transcript_65557/m.156725 type:complete len:529 (-) Transcript_65557:778-2364(-)
MKTECLREVQTAGGGSSVQAVHESLDAVAQGVRILKEQGAVLFEGVGVGQEHGLRSDDLRVDDGEKLDDGLPSFRRELTAENLPELPQASLAELGDVGHLPVGSALHAHAAELLSERQGFRLQLPGALEEPDQLFEASHRLDDLGEVAGELYGAQDVVPVPLSSFGIGDAQHPHRLAGLAHRRVHTALGQGQEGLADAEDQLRQVEGAQNVLGENLPVHHQAEGLLGGGGGVVVVHQRGGHLDEGGARHGGDHTGGVAVHTASHSNDQHRPPRPLRGPDGFQQLGLAIGLRALAGLARGMGEVEARAVSARERSQQVIAIAQSITSLPYGDHWVDVTAVVPHQEVRQALHAVAVGALVGHHWQVQAPNLEGGRLLLRMHVGSQGLPLGERLLEAGGFQRAEDGRQGSATHALGLGGGVLKDAAGGCQGIQRVLVLLSRGDVGQLNATEGQHGEDHRQRHLPRLPGAHEDQQRGAVGPLQDQVTAQRIQGIEFRLGILGKLWPVVGHTLLPDPRRRVPDLCRCDLRCDA